MKLIKNSHKSRNAGFIELTVFGIVVVISAVFISAATLIGVHRQNNERSGQAHTNTVQKVKCILPLVILALLGFTFTGCKSNPAIAGDNWPYKGSPMVGTNTIPVPKW
jgi:hypothetical protein